MSDQTSGRLLCGDEWSWILLDLVIVASGLTEMGVTLVTRMVNDGHSFSTKLEFFPGLPSGQVVHFAMDNYIPLGISSRKW